MTDIRVEAMAAQGFARAILVHHGVDPGEADEVTAALLWCDLRGLTSQGLGRVPMFVRRLKEGGIVSPCAPEIRPLGPAVEAIEGHGGFGQVLGALATRRAVQLSRTAGLSAVVVRNSNHFGAAGYFAFRAAEAGMVALVTSNAFPTVAALGGCTPVLGTNPLAFGAPQQSGAPLIIDMGTSYGSMTAAVDRASRAGAVGEGVAVDHEGKPVTEAHRLRDGAVLPLGARGFALGLMVEILAGVLSGSGYGDSLQSFYRHPDRPGALGHLIICLRVETFMPLAEFTARLNHLADFVKGSAPLDPQHPVRLPGEQRCETERRNRAEGRIGLERKTIDALEALGAEAGVSPPWP